MSPDRNRISFIALVVAMALGPAVMIGKCVLRPEGDDFGKIDSRVSMSVLLVTVDGLGPGALHVYDETLPKQPGVDELARLGIRVDLAFAASDGEPRTAAAILTGQLPSTLGIVDWSDRLPAGSYTLAKSFGARGFATGAFTNAPLFSLTGLSAGFALVHEDLNADSVGLGGAAAKWLASVGRQPFFLWVHCTPDPVVAGGADADPAQVFDRLVASLSDALTAARWYEGTLIVAAGTYDESGGELLVPLIWKVPKRQPISATRMGPCSLLDVAPTILDFLSMEGALKSAGRSLMRGKDGNAPLLSSYYFNDRAMFERYADGNRDPVLGLRVPTYELTYGGKPPQVGLFDRSGKVTNPPNLARNPKYKNVIDGKGGLLPDLFERRRRCPPPQKAEKAPPMSEATRAIVERRQP